MRCHFTHSRQQCKNISNDMMSVGVFAVITEKYHRGNGSRQYVDEAAATQCHLRYWKDWRDEEDRKMIPFYVQFPPANVSRSSSVVSTCYVYKFTSLCLLATNLRRTPFVCPSMAMKWLYVTRWSCQSRCVDWVITRTRHIGPEGRRHSGQKREPKGARSVWKPQVAQQTWRAYLVNKLLIPDRS